MSNNLFKENVTESQAKGLLESLNITECLPIPGEPIAAKCKIPEPKSNTLELVKTLKENDLVETVWFSVA